MKNVTYVCNNCRFDIKDKNGYGLMWKGSYGKEDLDWVGLQESENHLCFNCISKIKYTPIPGYLLPKLPAKDGMKEG